MEQIGRASLNAETVGNSIKAIPQRKKAHERKKRALDEGVALLIPERVAT